MAHYQPSKWLVQSAPPDMAEGSTRWAFAVYEILDKRHSPVDPRLVHSIYRGVVELEPEEIPDPTDPMFTAKLEDAAIKKFNR
jgi:hypothetical protein